MNEAELLFTDILKYDRHKLYLDKSINLDKNQRYFISQTLKRRIKGEPIQYILGKTEFMELEFRVKEGVFIPRPETEILVETAIKIGYRLWVISHRLRVLDIGTGCGNIAISMVKNLPYCEMEAIDISEPALEVAKENAELNSVNVNFIHSDLFNAYDLTPNTYDLIVSNPPYISCDDIKDLPTEIRYEPRIALDGGKDGLDFYRRISGESSHYLRIGGFLIIEMGFGQYLEIKNIFERRGHFKIIDIIKDYNDIDRVMVVRYG